MRKSFKKIVGHHVRKALNMHRVLIVVAALCLWLPAIASDFGWQPDLKERARHPRHAGYVALHVISSLDPDEAQFQGWGALRVRRTDKAGRSYTLQGTRAGISSGQVFAGALPAGDYEMLSLRGVDAERGIEGTLSVPILADYARFRVAAGRLSDLGTLILGIDGRPVPAPRNPFYRKLPMQQWRVASRPGLIRWLHAVYPWLAPVRDSGQAVASAAPGPLERAMLGSVASPKRLDDGSLLLPDRLGQVRMYRAGRTWQLAESGFSVDVLDAIDLDGRLLLAGDRGLIARERAEGGFDLHTGPAGDLVVHWLGRVAGAVYALGERPQEAQLLRLDATAAHWEIVARFTRREGFRPASTMDGPWTLLGSPAPRGISRPTRALLLAQQTDGLLLAVGSKRWFYRHADGALQARGRGPALAAMYLQANGVRIARPADDGAVEDALYSLDAGLIWLLARRPSAPGNLSLTLRRAPPYVDSNGAVLWIGPRLMRDEQLRIVATPESYLLKARKASDRLGWQALRLMQPGCSRLLGSLSRDEEWYVQCDDLRILRSADRGAQWQTVWASTP